MRKKINKKIVIILLLFISIGYAFLSATLNINGLIGYKGNRWNIYFDNVSILKNDISAERPTINNEQNTVNFSASFSEPGEVFKFSVDVINDGTLDAMLSEVLKTGIDSTNSKYISYTVKYYDDTELNIKDAIKAGSKTRINVEVRYKYETDELAPAGTKDYSIALTYVQATRDAHYISPMYESNTNNILTLNNVKANSLSNLRIYGSTKQTQYTGQNLYNVKDTNPAEPYWITNGASLGSGDWISMSYDNTAGDTVIYSDYFVNNLNVNEGEQFLVVFEIKEVSGTGRIYPSSTYEEEGQFVGNHYYEFNNINAGEIYTYEVTSRETPKHGLRTFTAFDVGDSGSITFRVSLLKDTSVTPENFVYEPYVGGIASPNPKYPQDVHNVKNSVTIKTAKSISNFPYENGTKSVTGVTVYNLNFKILNEYSSLISGKPEATEYRVGNRWDSKEKVFSVEPNTTYYFENNLNLSANITLVDSTNNSYREIYVISGDSFTTSATEDGISSLRICVDTSTTYDNTLVTYHIYKDYKTHELSLGNIELSHLNNKCDYIYYENGNWYVKKVVGNYTINGSEQYSYEADIPRIYYSLNASIKLNNNYYPHDQTTIPDIISNKFIKTSIHHIFYASNKLPGFTISENNILSFAMKYWTTEEEALAEVIGTKFYYPYKAGVVEKITDTTLVNQLNNILNDNLYEGVNYIKVTGSDLAPTIKFDYVQK